MEERTASNLISDLHYIRKNLDDAINSSEYLGVKLFGPRPSGTEKVAKVGESVAEIVAIIGAQSKQLHAMLNAHHDGVGNQGKQAAAIGY